MQGAGNGFDRRACRAFAIASIALAACDVPLRHRTYPPTTRKCWSACRREASPQFRELKVLQAAAALAPDDPAPAIALATAYLRASRVEGDPRFAGYAQAALARWWQDPEAPTAVLMLRATILQNRHEFDAATRGSRPYPEREPRHAQALLTRATVLTVRGKFAEARADCDRLRGLVPGDLRGDLHGGDRQRHRQAPRAASSRSPRARWRARRRRRARLGRVAARRNRASPRRRRGRTTLPRGARRRPARPVLARRLQRLAARPEARRRT